MTNTKKNLFSLLSCIAIVGVLIGYRISFGKLDTEKPLVVTTYDALGYYIYLPSTLIYQDATELEWFPAIDSAYQVTGGKLYQANRNTEGNGNYVFKYLGGVSILQLPFFGIAHGIALSTNYKADGFSPPYQWAMAFGGLFYCLFGLFLLRLILLKYFNDKVTALTLLLLFLATNVIQYLCIDSAMSHSYIFILYPLLIWYTIKWHNSPALKYAAAIGFIIGLATICRPTEAIMFVIPLLWNTHNKAARDAKWKLVWENKTHIIPLALFGILGILPQLLYWLSVTGSLVYNVGSKWTFLNPWFRVLFGITNGWFIYTPIAIFMIIGLFFTKDFPFKKSVATFIILNIWIVIAWFDWRYGATYSCRAFVQSSAVFAFPLAAFLAWFDTTKLKWIVYPIGAFLIYLNLFQIGQYNDMVLHYYDMNTKYYSKIFLNHNPTPLDMSLLDNEDFLDSEDGYTKNELIKMTGTHAIPANEGSAMLVDTALDIQASTSDQWIRISLENTIDQMIYNGSITSSVLTPDTVLTNKVRIYNPLTIGKKINKQDYYVRIPAGIIAQRLEVKMEADRAIVGSFGKLEIIELAQD